MTNIPINETTLSIELVPRQLNALIDEARDIALRFPQLAWLNIPDIKRLPVRSHDAAIRYLRDVARTRAVADTGRDVAHRPLTVIPHVRTRDRSVQENVDLLHDMATHGVTDVLIVTGDRVDQGERADFTRTLHVLRAAREARVPMELWAAFDPYRGELRGEIDYAREKIDAGAKGFFTQPFFDERLAEMCLDQLAVVPTFIGICPVTSERSAKYWERENRVVFPPGFEMSLEHGAKLTARLVRLAIKYKQHAYLMPITVDASTYLTMAFQQLRALIDADTVQPWGTVLRRA